MGEKNKSVKTGRPVKQEGDISTEEKIFIAATDLFAEKGYAETSMREIASRSGITEGAIYRHYKNKDAILCSIFDYLEKQIYHPLVQINENSHSIFRKLLEMLPDYLYENPRIIKISRILIHEMHKNPKVSNYFQDMYGTKADIYTETVFREQIKDGKLKSIDVHTLAIFFNTFRFGWFYRNFILRNNEPVDTEKMKDDMNAVILLFEQVFENTGT